jgi:hypothetical protein
VRYVVLDTDVASLSHKERIPESLAPQLLDKVTRITFFTYGELTKWAELRA